MATLTLILSATLRKYVENYDPYTGQEVAFSEPLTVQEFIDTLGIPASEIHIIMMNNAHAHLDTILTDKARLALFPAVGGG